MSINLDLNRLELDFNLVYYKDLGLIICNNITCNYSLNSTSSSSSTISSIRAHLIRKHNINNKDFKNLKPILDKLEFKELNNIKIDSYKYYFKELKEEEEGFKCLINNCSFINSSLKGFKNHLKSNKHNIILRSRDKDSSKFYKIVKIQSLHTNPKFINYFITKNSKKDLLALDSYNLEENLEDTTSNNSNRLESSLKDNNKDIYSLYKEALVKDSNLFKLNYNKLDNKEIPSLLKKLDFNKYYNNKELNKYFNILVVPIKNYINSKERIYYTIYNSIITSILPSLEKNLEFFSKRLLQ